MLAVFAVTALAQAKECNDEFKSATYQKWYDNRKEHQDVAYQAAKEYLTVCSSDDSPYSKALKKFASDYDAIKTDTANRNQFQEAYTKHNYAEQIRTGKLILAGEPDNVAVLIIMGVAGDFEPTLLSESAPYAKKAIEMIEAGKPFAPYATKDQALASLNYGLAKTNVKAAPADAIPYFVKALKFESDLKKNPQVYAELAAAYGEGPVAKLADEYKKFVGQDVTTESKLALENLNQAIDRQIDALARAAALASNAADKKSVMDVLAGIYKDRNKTDAGLNEKVASILSTPLPGVPMPITTLPTPTPASTPSNDGPGTSGATSSNTGTNGQNKTGATGAQNNKTTGGAKPGPSPTPAIKKPRRANHSRG